ncbi:MAG: acyl-CoA thioesterase II [Desulfobacula sp.]|jgi:acyl-CoA thioesterase-2|nr:acyl-CoA thioesterase II [Desulfobacula sp.]
MKDENTENVLEKLLSLLKLERIETNIFRGQSQDLGFGNLFGGQVMGQALSAATRTVDLDFHAHSLHGYFLLAGDAKKPVVYTVDRIRDGRSFITRRVVALQDGRAIFTMAASFHKTEPGFDHQDPMPKIEGPDGIESEVDMAKRLAHRIPPEIYEKLVCKKPIEIRVVNPINPFAPKTLPPEKYVWFRAIDKITDDMATHRCMLAYASDFHLVGTALYPHGKTFWSRDMQVASLDHCIWFHREFKMNDWLLYAMKSPSAASARGLSLGSIFTRDGVLVASVAQEGLLRPLSQ